MFTRDTCCTLVPYFEVQDGQLDAFKALADPTRREIMRLEPQQLYFPLGIGGHVDHVLCREVGLALARSERGWVMPEPDMADRLSFYEDFPYAWWTDFGRLEDLRYVRDAGDHVAIGALTRHRDLEIDPLLAESVPLLSHAAGEVGDPQVRHRGTIGGSLAHADPASDLPAVLLALGGSLVATGPSGEREIPATEFFTGFLESALEPDELLTEVRVPKLATEGWSFQKFNRRAQDWAIVGVAAWRRNGESGVALVNMGSTPIFATSVVEALRSDFLTTGPRVEQFEKVVAARVGAKHAVAAAVQ